MVARRNAVDASRRTHPPSSSLSAAAPSSASRINSLPPSAAGYLYAKHLTSGCLRLPETALSSGIKNSGRPLDSGWVVQRSGRRGCQFASAGTEPTKVIFLPLQNKRTCIAESPMLECSSTHSLRGCAPQCGYVQMQVLQNFA